ncbi:MAG: septum formation protein Maf, partial [Deltaproteobacteria bacterium]
MLRDPSPPLVLASASPRRRELLTRAGVPLELASAEIDETPLPHEPPHAHARRLSAAKARAVARRLGPAPRRFVLAGDTIVELDGELLGKPGSAENAIRLLQRLLGRTHRVVTGLTVLATDAPDAFTVSVESRVTMRAADASEVRAYAETGEPLDCAGAYALQGGGRRFVVRVEGSETNVIGLPIDEALDLLRKAG